MKIETSDFSYEFIDGDNSKLIVSNTITINETVHNISYYTCAYKDGNRGYIPLLTIYPDKTSRLLSLISSMSIFEDYERKFLDYLAREVGDNVINSLGLVTMMIGLLSHNREMAHKFMNYEVPIP